VLQNLVVETILNLFETVKYFNFLSEKEINYIFIYTPKLSKDEYKRKKAREGQF
jgi:hypothetical protein